MRKEQTGFSLVEVAIVLVIIGLLVGAILKGQELMNSARARSLADLTSDAQAAYFGFVDRFHKVPGDWNATSASGGIGATIVGGGNDNGRIDNDTAVPGITTIWQESNALWEQVSRAGFMDGAYRGSSEPPTATNNLAPTNAFNQVVVLGRTDDYLDLNSPLPRLLLVMGRAIPVDIAREVDVKVDDGNPRTGSMRLSVDTGATFGLVGEGDATCIDGAGNYDVASDSQDCNLIYLY